MVNLWVWEKILAPILVTLDQGHQATEAGQNLICPHDKARTAHPIATRRLKNISAKFQIRISPIVHFICHILGMVGPIDVKQ